MEFQGQRQRRTKQSDQDTSNIEFENVRYRSDGGSQCLSIREYIEPTSNDQAPSQHANRKRYRRFTQREIQTLEIAFNECPLPDVRKRKELSDALGLIPQQVMFWFQNKRTHMKAKREKNENRLLKEENEKLQAENLKHKELQSIMSFTENQLRETNTCLQQEITRISGMVARPENMMSTSPTLSNSVNHSLLNTVCSLLSNQHGLMERPLITEIALDAMDELMKMAEAKEPLWLLDHETSTYSLNENEYTKAFRKGSEKPSGWRTEATRETAEVLLTPEGLVYTLMTVKPWSALFSNIVSSVEAVSAGVKDSYNGAFQVMIAAYQVQSPLVPVRECSYVRYCKQHSNDIWAVVDVSLDDTSSNMSMRCRKRPSGCVIKKLSRNSSKVTWVEHFEVENISIHPLYRSLVNSGLAFGAKHWIVTLQRQIARLSFMTRNFSVGGITLITSTEGRRYLLRLSDKMVVSVRSGITESKTRRWSNISDANNQDVKVIIRKFIDGPEKLSGLSSHVICASTSLWLPVPPRRLFDFLSSVTYRSEWDILSKDTGVQLVDCTANGPEKGDSVSILSINNKTDILVLQESSFSTTGSYVVYSPINAAKLNIALRGGEVDNVLHLPSGFIILPDCPVETSGREISGVGCGGTLLTIAFQLLIDSPQESNLAANVNKLISFTTDKIKTSLLGDEIQHS